MAAAGIPVIPGGEGGARFLVRALFVDVWAWLAFVHTGSVAPLPSQKSADFPRSKETVQRVPPVELPMSH